MGLLYDLANPTPLDFSSAAENGIARKESLVDRGTCVDGIRATADRLYFDPERQAFYRKV